MGQRDEAKMGCGSQSIASDFRSSASESGRQEPTTKELFAVEICSSYSGHSKPRATVNVWQVSKRRL